jgi:hypothetical protein
MLTTILNNILRNYIISSQIKIESQLHTHQNSQIQRHGIIYCIGVCVCVCEREREGERERQF